MVFPGIRKDKYLRAVSGLSLLILVSAAVVFGIGIGFFEGPLIIHFDAYKGINFLAGKAKVFGMLISALAMILLNLSLCNFLYKRERFLSYLFAFISLEL